MALVESLQIDSKYLLALWLAWKLPEINRHQATLSKTDNPLILEALATIEGGNETLKKAARANSPVAVLLDQVNAYPPPAKYLQLLKEKASLPRDLWKDKEPVMVGQIADPFGDFDEPALHECKTWFETEGPRDGPQQTKLVQTGHLWRKGKERKGRPVFYCQGCYEKRVRRIVNQVVSEAYKYPRWQCPMVITTTQEHEIKRAINRWKARGTKYIYKLLPQATTEAVIIHNQGDDLAGDPIPMTRKELFELLYPYCQTPEGRRIDGSKGFGLDYAGDKGDGRKKGGSKAKSDEANEDDQPQQKIRIRGAGYSYQVAALRQSGFLDEEKSKAGKARFTQGLTWPEYIETLDLAGVKWKAIEGEELLLELLNETEITTYVQETAIGKSLVRKSLNEAKNEPNQPPPKMRQREIIL